MKITAESNASSVRRAGSKSGRQMRPALRGSGTRAQTQSHRQGGVLVAHKVAVKTDSAGESTQIIVRLTRWDTESVPLARDAPCLPGERRLACWNARAESVVDYVWSDRGREGVCKPAGFAKARPIERPSARACIVDLDEPCRVAARRISRRPCLLDERGDVATTDGGRKTALAGRFAQPGRQGACLRCVPEAFRALQRRRSEAAWRAGDAAVRHDHGLGVGGSWAHVRTATELVGAPAQRALVGSGDRGARKSVAADA